MLKRFGCSVAIEMGRIKDLNNMVKQPSRGLRANPCQVTDHSTIKKRIRPMLGFKSFASASATLEGIEVVNMIHKGLLTPGICSLAQFAAVAA
jgi:putative transposase